MMDLVQLHALEPLGAPALVAELRRRVDERWLARWGRVVVSVTGPWRPADLWAGGIERLVWTASFSGDPGLSTEGRDALEAANSVSRRNGVASFAELLAPSLAGALVLTHSDAARSAYVASYRERRFRWSLRLDDGRLLSRCDGERVMVDAPPRFVAEVDRTGVLLAGFARFFGEALPVEGADRLVFVDTLASLAPESEATLRRDSAVEDLRRAATGK